MFGRAVIVLLSSVAEKRSELPLNERIGAAHTDLTP